MKIDGVEMVDYELGCPFCDKSQIKGEVLHLYGSDGSLHYVFAPVSPIDPVVPGHMLVVPARHVQDATEEPLATSMAAGVAARVAQRYRAANIITSIGVPATQTIPHLYLHVVPREEGDGLCLPWSPRPRDDGLPTVLSPRRGYW